jgi:hypothetical protein
MNNNPTPDELETTMAELMIAYMRNFIQAYKTSDIDAQVSALAARCFELSTPGLSDKNRAAIFWTEE